MNLKPYDPTLVLSRDGMRVIGRTTPKPKEPRKTYPWLKPYDPELV